MNNLTFSWNVWESNNLPRYNEDILVLGYNTDKMTSPGDFSDIELLYPHGRGPWQRSMDVEYVKIDGKTVSIPIKDSDFIINAYGDRYHINEDVCGGFYPKFWVYYYEIIPIID